MGFLRKSKRSKAEEDKKEKAREELLKEVSEKVITKDKSTFLNFFLSGKGALIFMISPFLLAWLSFTVLDYFKGTYLALPLSSLVFFIDVIVYGIIKLVSKFL